MEVFGDFGFVGGDDKTTNPFQDNQVCLNYFPEVSPNSRAKVAVSLLGAPGLIQLISAGPHLPPLGDTWPLPSTITNLPVRGSWVLPGRTQALAVAGDSCYLITIATPASATSQAVIAGTKVGTLASTTGFVSIRDNGLGGHAVLVDGPNYYLYNVATQQFSRGTDPAWLGSNTVAFIDGWWIFHQPNTQTFYTNAQPYSLALNASYFANADASGDRLVAVWENKEELWLIKEQTTEIWYNAGGPYFPFSRLVGTLLQVGCKAYASIARLSSDGQDGLIWFGRSERGENIVIRTKGFSAEAVTTPAVSNAISQYPVTADALGYTYQEGGHEFYVLNFPTADNTRVFDASVPLEMAWTQRASYDPYSKTLHRHRSNTYMNFAGMRIVGDYQNGSLYQMTRAAYTDAGWPILARRRAPYIWDKESRGRVFMASLQIEFAPGQGASTGLGADPHCSVSISHDGVHFGQKWPLPMGAIGNSRNRTMIRKLAFGRNNLVEVETVAPVNRDITGATLRAFAE